MDLEEIPPLAEKVLCGWQTEESDSEDYLIASSIRKKKQGKKPRKQVKVMITREGDQPFDGASTSERS